MADRWTRWRRYMDGWEEAAREAGAQMAEVTTLLADLHERHTWRATQQEGVAAEMVRRARDIPGLRELVMAAARLGEMSPTAPDVPFRRWPAAHGKDHRGSCSLESIGQDGIDTESDINAQAGDPQAAPPRLRAAERALAHRTRSLAVCLESLCHPNNISAILRTAEVLGLQEMHIIQPEGRPPVRPSITMSGHHYLDVSWHRDTLTALQALRCRGYRVLAADHGAGSLPLHRVDLAERVAVVLGSEQMGVSATLREAADGLFHIPAVGFSSYLNVSTAAAIVMYELDRRMREAGLRAPLAPDDRARVRRAWYDRLARGRPQRRQDYQRWLADPPPPAPDQRPSPSREKARAAARGRNS